MYLSESMSLLIYLYTESTTDKSNRQDRSRDTATHYGDRRLVGCHFAASSGCVDVI